MAQDIMPDWNFLSSHSQLALTDASVNGLYYNPTISYTPPPKADGTLYPASAFSAAPVDGFDPSPTRPVVNLSSYNGQYDISRSVSFNPPVEYPTAEGPSEINYSVTVAAPRAGSYDAPASCPPGTQASGSQDEYCFYPDDPSPKYYEFYDDVENGTWYVSKCNQEGYIYNKRTNKCLVKTSVLIARNCPDGETSLGTTTIDYNENRDICVAYGDSFFTFSVAGTRHYVGTSGSCAEAGLNADVCVDLSQTDPSDPTVQAGMSGADVLQNVANWFSYYHTRILMARTGVMKAFLTMNVKYRLGFGSIDGSGASWIENNAPPYFSFSGDNRLAGVEPFGDGSSGTRKAQFWAWMAGKVRASGSTPLRDALKAVGRYYETAQAWASPDPNSTATDYLACRQSYVILTTDGFWNGGSPNVGDQDDNAGQPITGPDNASFTYTPAPPFEDDRAQSDTLADVAMKYWKTDLMPATGAQPMVNEVPTNSADPAFWQHMVTFTMGMGFTPKDADGNPIDSATVNGLFQWSQTGTKPDSLSAWGGWPSPSSGSIRNIADLVHAGVNGHGGFYSAKNPESFVSGLKNALQRAQARTGSGASLAASSTELNTGTMIYQGFYRTAVWTGDLKAYSIDPETGVLSPTPLDASSAMPSAADRTIYTYAPSAAHWAAGPSTSGAYVEFRNNGATPPAALTDAERTALGSDPTHQAAMVNYLRGDDSQNSTFGYRNRLSALGDIVDSSPVYVAAPGVGEYDGGTFSGASSYAGFASTHSGRAPTLYVSANDGMLHAFDASTFKEVYAFLPGAVITHGGVDGDGNTVGVSELANPGYGIDTAVPHQYFNDGELAVADAYFNNAWHTVLVGTTGRGLARTIYALDVTDPSTVKFLWERSAWDGGGNSGYIGQMVGQPVIAQVADGHWAVLIGNGYNSANGVAALLQFRLSDGTLSVHLTPDMTTDNGLAAPAVWIDDSDENISTVAYAGDLHGHVWSFSLANATSGGTKLFTATYTDGSGNVHVQPITAGMLAGLDPDTGNRWVFFGTGQYLSSDDISDLSVQTWYGLIVQSPDNPSLVTNLLADGRSALAKRAIIAQIPGDPPIPPTRVVSPPNDPNTQSIDGKSGWYIDLQTPIMSQDGTVASYVSNGERMVVPNQFQRGRLVGTTGIPKSDDLCNPTGTGWIMAVEPFTGTNPKPPLFGINGDGIVNGQDVVQVRGKSFAAAGVGYNTLLNAPIAVGNRLYPGAQTGGLVPPLPLASGDGNFTRVSWREMVNP